MHWLLYIIIATAVLGGISALLWKRGVSPFFVLTFFFQGAIAFAISGWESGLWNPYGGIVGYNFESWHYGFWYYQMWTLLPSLFLAFFAYEHIKGTMDMDAFKKVIYFMVFVYGNNMVFGALEDFGCYIIWGLDKFYEMAPIFHGDRFLFGVPTLYYMIIPGIIIQIVAMYLSMEMKE